MASYLGLEEAYLVIVGSGSPSVSHVSFEVAVTSAPVSILNVTVLPFLNRSVFHTPLLSSDTVSRNADSVELSSSSTSDKFLFVQTALK